MRILGTKARQFSASSAITINPAPIKATTRQIIESGFMYRLNKTDPNLIKDLPNKVSDLFIPIVEFKYMLIYFKFFIITP